MAEDPAPQDSRHHDIDAEQTVLRGMLRSADTIADVVEILAPQDFYRPGHELLYLAILDLYHRGAADAPAPTTTAVRARLEEQDQLETAGGADYLHTLRTMAASATSSTRAAETVRGHAVLRRLKDAAQHIDALTDEAEATTAETLADTAQAEILAASAGRAGLRPSVSFDEVLESVLDEIEAIGSKQRVYTGVPTGFHDLDRLTGGLRPGQLTVIAGRPAMGATTLALDFLRSASIQHHLPAVMFTRDASLNDIGMRLLAAEAGVARHHMLSGKLTDEDWMRMARKMPTITDAPLFLQDDANATFTQLRSQCRRLHARQNLQLVVVDPVQMLDYGTRPLGSRYEEVSEIARQLKLLALELQIPIVAVSTLNRGPEQRDDKKPRLNDLRDSGALEDVADLVLLLYREDAYDRESPRAGEADFIIPKFNNGPTATVTVAFQGHYARFVDFAPSPNAVQTLR